MPTVSVVVASKLSRSMRVRQLEAMFDVPPSQHSKLNWKGDVPLEEKPWNVGLVVGPSGCGKSTVVRELFREPRKVSWKAPAVIDDFAAALSIEQISKVCQSVGFNTIPAWMRPFAVLSNGEQFRVTMARRLLEEADPIVVDEFTSVVDRQVAKIGAHAVQKWARANNRQFVAATCHFDVLDWLNPDWTLEPATMTFRWRSLRPRPTIAAEIARVPYSVWYEFAPYHYLTAELSRVAQCFALLIGGRPVAFAGMLHRPHPRVRDITGCSRLVTLPDWQGLGLAMILIDTLGSAYRAIGRRVHTYPAHPSLIRSFSHSPRWKMEKRPGLFSPTSGTTSALSANWRDGGTSSQGGRPCGVFSFIGEAMERFAAQKLLARTSA